MSKEIGRRNDANIDYLLSHLSNPSEREAAERRLLKLSPLRVARIRANIEKERKAKMAAE